MSHLLDDSRRLSALERTGLLGAQQDEALDNIAVLATQLLRTPVALICLVTPDQQIFSGRAGIPADHPYARGTPLSHSFCRFAVESAAELSVHDARTHAQLHANPSIADLQIIAYLGVPLVLTSGEVLGTLCVTEPKPRVWTLEERAALQRLARIATAELQLRLDLRRSAELQASQAESERELQLLRTAVGRLNDVVLITEAEPIDDGGPRIVYVNAAFERQTGYTAEEAIGRTPRMLQGPLSERAPLDRIRKALQEWRPIRTELLNYKKSGATFWSEIEIVPVANADGWYTHWVSVQRDISDRKQLEADLRQSQRLESLGQFAGGIAHDFANIVAIIAASAELLDQDVAPDVRADVQAIRSASMRAGALVGQILAFSRRQVLNVHPVSLREVVRHTEAMLRRLLQSSILLEVVLPPDDVMVMADDTQIVQVLMNLAANSRDAMPTGGHLHLEVTSAETAVGRFGRIVVRDTGVGIPAEHIPLIFDPFFTTKSAGGGTGFGLATVHGIVHQLGGALQVRSTLHVGTTFEIDLPWVASQALQPLDGAPSAPSVSPASRHTLLAGRRVLIVEDEPALRRATQRLLERYGVLVETATDGLAALERLRGALPLPDLVLTDLIMPELGGRALAEALRADGPQLPVLFMSGYDAGTAMPALGDGLAIGHVQKPFEMEDLLAAVEHALSAR